MMNCDEIRPLLSAYGDNELTVTEMESVKQHVATCASCAAHLAGLKELSTQLQHPDLRYAPRRAFRADLAAQLNREREKRPRFSLPTFGYGALTGLAAAALALIVFMPVITGTKMARKGDPLYAEMVNDHVRSLLAEHLIDVKSSDRHTVKPWFLGKIDYSPTVPNLADAGFPLVGGRLDYVHGHPAPALVYGRNKHRINVFVLPSAEAPTANNGVETESMRGYNVVRWELGDLVYWAVSAVAMDDLVALSRAFQTSVGTKP